MLYNYLDILIYIYWKCIYIYLSWNISINIHMGQSPKSFEPEVYCSVQSRLALTTSLPTNQQLAGRKFIKHKQLKKNTWCFFYPSFKLSLFKQLFFQGSPLTEVHGKQPSVVIFFQRAQKTPPSDSIRVANLPKPRAGCLGGHEFGSWRKNPGKQTGWYM